MKHSTRYLYGCSPDEFSALPYRDALHYKIDSAREHLQTVTKELDAAMMRNDDRKMSLQYQQSAIYRAIRYTESLLEELEG